MFKPTNTVKTALIALLLLVNFMSFGQKRYSTYGVDEKDGYKFTMYQDDPLQSRVYKLENGLTVVLSKNTSEPRIQTIIATKAGGKNDPAENTGLAHYLEHMLFKGTDKYGTSNYKMEKVYLDQVDSLYEVYNQEKDSAKRVAIYAEIDKSSLNASKYSIANEYDKMLQSMGAKGTNAFTSEEVTAYINDIPSNQLHKFLQIEQERFRNPVLRLFHTELEAVYEEKNISLDNDYGKQREILLADLFKKHAYGTQTIIGKTEHLKNPSLKAIREYFHTYYVPNNMVVILSGDLDYDETIKMVDKHFGSMKPKTVPTYTFEREFPSAKPREYSVVGPQAESVLFGFRMPGANSKEKILLQVVDLLLSNSEAGLIDLNLNKKQKVLRAYCSPNVMKDYSVHYFSGQPKEDQTLEEVKELLLEQIELIKKGEFDTSLLQSLIANERVQNMETYESNSGRAFSLLDVFVNESDYLDFLNTPYHMSQLTKQDIMDFANSYYKEDYCVVYKRQGKKTAAAKIVKPQISNVELNRDKESPFVTNIVAEKVHEINPDFIDFNEAISSSKLGNSPFWYVQNKDNDLFTLYYVLDIGKYNDKKIPFAINYLQYLGTDKYTSEEISKKFYSLACNYGISTGGKQSYVYLSGLQDNFDEALSLFEHLLSNVKVDDQALNNLKLKTFTERENQKKSKAYLARALTTYARYGKDNPLRYNLTNTEVQALTSTELVQKIKGLTAYKHKIYYYGPESEALIKSKVKEKHKGSGTKESAPAYEFTPLEQKDKVYFLDYNMVQASINWVATGNTYDPKNSATIKMFNSYFGSGMSSVVFQNIREAKALAYSTYAVYFEPSEIGKKCGAIAYIGTQADKLHDAISGMNDLFKELPKSESSFNQAKESLLSQIRTERINKTDLFFTYSSNLKLGTSKDKRHPIYHELEKITFEDIAAFHTNMFTNNNFSYAIMGSKEKIKLSDLKQYGNLIELSIDDLLNY